MTDTNQTSRAIVAVPTPSAKAMAYYRSGNALWLADVLLGLAIPALFLWTGLSGRVRDFARRVGRNWLGTIVVFFIVVACVHEALHLPLEFYRGFVRQHAYGLSNQTFAKWAGDWLKSLAVTVVTGSLVLWVPYWLLRKSPRCWWLWTGLLAVPFLCFTMLVRPVWVDPLFNKFGPMQDKALEARILALAERAGIEGSRVFEVNKSVDTKMLNAYVTGFAGTKRIVLWDTIIAKLPPDELLFVMAHEMGHYVLRHVAKGIAFGSLLTLLSLYLAHRAAGWLIERHKQRWGFDQLSDIASLPLLALLAGTLALLTSPVALAFSRHIEHEADLFALALTNDGHAGASAFVALQASNLANPRPGPLYIMWRASHPPLGARIDFCNEYRSGAAP